MDLMTEESTATVSDFYDSLAPDYDAMTGFTKRFVHERPFFRLLVERYGIGTALDAGCGTGFHSLLLSQLGVHVTAVDVSNEMLSAVARHAKEMDVDVGIVKSTFQHIPNNVSTNYDAVFSMGNSLAHLLSSEELLASLRSFASVLKPGGVLFVQNLNYDRIMNSRERIQSIKESNGITFVRYYEYLEERINFQILKVQSINGVLEHKLMSVMLRPILKDDFVQLLRQAGFNGVKFFGGISMEEFHSDTSRDLVVLATKAK
ncbi:MAG: methyltransferase domain-containing protein [Ignavibacteriae bacterium]|nr:methyltransferase domain-containing protein [Ignavibacteriota bacterium]